MSATLSQLNRTHDVSGVSGEGDDIATICEFSSGLVAMHWNSPTPSVTVHTDVRHIIQLHGHQGATLLVPAETRLEKSYRLVMPYLKAGDWVTCGPHPDHPDRLRVTLPSEGTWLFWIALFDGSSFAASHEDTGGGEMQHTWVSPDGDLWLQYFTRIPTNDHPLDTFDREDR